LGLALALGGLAVRLEGAADRLGELPALARSARAMARRLSLGPEELSEDGEGFVAARGPAAARGEPALREVFARELEVLPSDLRCSIAMARRLSLGPLLLLPAPGTGALLACSGMGLSSIKLRRASCIFGPLLLGKGQSSRSCTG